MNLMIRFRVECVLSIIPEEIVQWRDVLLSVIVCSLIAHGRIVMVVYRVPMSVVGSLLVKTRGSVVHRRWIADSVRAWVLRISRVACRRSVGSSYLLCLTESRCFRRQCRVEQNAIRES